MSGTVHRRRIPRYRVLRFWNEEVVTNIDGVLEHILKELGEDAR